MIITGINERAMYFLRTCERCHGSRSLPSVPTPPCPACTGRGVVECRPDSDSLAYLGGSTDLHHFLARLLLTLAKSRREEARLLTAGFAERAVIESARRSGMAEVASALDLWLTAKMGSPEGREGA